MIGIGLGRVEARLEGGQQIVMDDVKDIQFVTGITKLVYVVLFNFFSPYDEETNSGSDFSNMVANLIMVIGKPEYSMGKIGYEIENIKNRIKYSQNEYMNEYKVKIPDSELLRDIEVLRITPDETKQLVNIDFKIVNEEGKNCYVTT